MHEGMHPHAFFNESPQTQQQSAMSADTPLLCQGLHACQ